MSVVVKAIQDKISESDILELIKHAHNLEADNNKALYEAVDKNYAEMQKCYKMLANLKELAY